MKIKKIGHCCLFIQTEKLNILTDPGSFSLGQEDLKSVDVVLITHEHGDHLHTGSLKKVLQNNPQAKVITNTGVSKILDEEKIPYEILDGENNKEINGLLLESFDCKHEEIFGEIGQVQNTAYFIDEKLFYPGDSFFNPKKQIEILALPVAGPWCKLSNAINYALELKPKKAFPVHDGMLQKDKIGSVHRIPKEVLNNNGIEFTILTEGEEKEF